jgi:hypothetical protein
VSNECLGARPDASSIGIMLDGGGSDLYEYPDDVDPDFVVPTEGGTWGWEVFDLPSEHGGGADGEDETGIHG